MRLPVWARLRMRRYSWIGSQVTTHENSDHARAAMGPGDGDGYCSGGDGPRRPGRAARGAEHFTKYSPLRVFEHVCESGGAHKRHRRHDLAQPAQSRRNGFTCPGTLQPQLATVPALAHTAADRGALRAECE